MTALFVVGIFLVGIFLSAFFSGSETGFYRATRTRLALDALSGDRVSRGLRALTNHPALFVATTLVGNNLANYLTSWAIVLGAMNMMLAVAPRSASSGYAVDLLVSVMLSPIIFVYGELMPKNLFFQAPNRLLRAAGPLLLFFSVLFAPLSGILWLLGRLVERIVGVSPTRLQLKLARRELQRVLSEGHEAGVLHPTQRRMADGMFQMATLRLEQFCLPPARLAVVRDFMNRQDMLRIARRRRSAVLFVQDQRREVCGFLHVIELHLQSGDQPPAAAPLIKLPRNTSPVAALTRMQEDDQPYALIVDDKSGQTQGIVEAAQLAAAVLATNR